MQVELIKKYQETFETTQNSLKENSEWINRYAGYADMFKKNEEAFLKHLDTLNNALNLKPTSHLALYLTTSRIKKTKLCFDLRFRGQSIAEISPVKNDKYNVKFAKDKKGRNRNEVKENADDFTCMPIDLLKELNKRLNNEDIEHNKEHLIESVLLGNFSLPDAAGKCFKGIQPIKYAGCRFAMPTPFSASKAKDGKVKYSGFRGGSIDIFTRTTGKHISVIELKDESAEEEAKELPEDAIRQAIVYATFIRELLRTPKAKSDDWYDIFGFTSNVPKKLNIKTIIAMPYSDKNSTSFKNIKLNFPESGDTLELHYFYFDKDLKQKAITSLKELNRVDKNDNHNS